MAITYEEFLKKIPTKEQMDAIVELSEMLNEIDLDEKSYLKEELAPYVKALEHITNKGHSKEVTIKDLETLKGFEQFLLAGDYQTNYGRIQTDAAFNGERMGSMKLENGIKALNSFLDLGIDIKKLDDATAKKGVNLTRQRRAINTKQIIDLNQLLREEEKGKTFMDAVSQAGKSVGNMVKNLETVLKTLNGEQEIKGITAEEKADLAAKVGDFTNAVKALSDPKKLSAEDAKKALDTVRAFPAYLESGINNSNYKRLVAAGLKEVTFANGMRALDKTLNNKIDLEHIKKARGYQVVSKTADEWIKGWREGLKTNPNSFAVGSKDAKMTIARIMATRMLVNSVRGEGGAFSDRVTNLDIDNKAKELLANPTYAEFVNGVVKNRKSLAEAAKSISKGHGGGLDDAFKKYLLNSPAGKLPNEPALSRYMPTVLERIEFLQNMAKNKLNPVVGRGVMPKAEISEVYALRGMLRVKGGNKEDLKVKIPTDKDLKKATEENMRDGFFNKEFLHDDLNLFFKGHGGKFAQSELVKGDKINPGSPLWLSMNAGRDEDIINQRKYNMAKYADRMQYLRHQGMLVVTDLKEAIKKDPNSEETKALCEKAGKIILEEVALTEERMERMANPNPNLDATEYNPQRVKSIADSLDTPKTREELFHNDPNKYVEEMHKLVRNPAPGSYTTKLMKDHEDQVCWNPDKAYEHAKNRPLKPEELKEIQNEVQQEVLKQQGGLKGPGSH